MAGGLAPDQRLLVRRGEDRQDEGGEDGKHGQRVHAVDGHNFPRCRGYNFAGRCMKTRRKLPTSGSEPMFSDLIYGTTKGVENNNCYAWAIDAYRGSGGIKLQPGNISHQSSNLNASSCRFLRRRAMDDSRARGIYAVPPAEKCKPGYYKIMAFIDKGNDYHWYKQHGDLLYRVSPGETPASIARELGVPRKNVTSPTPAPKPGDLVFVRGGNVFSHKQGLATGPLLRDASKKVIPDPRRANRNYGLYNYRTFCGAMCIRNLSPSTKAGKQLTGREDRHLKSLLHRRMKMM